MDTIYRETNYANKILTYFNKKRALDVTDFK